ncbi:ferredoxin reductase-like protein [Hyaloscypha variabilis]
MTSYFLVGQLPWKSLLKSGRNLAGPFLRQPLSYRHFCYTQIFLNQQATVTSKRNVPLYRVYHEDQRSVLVRLSSRGFASVEPNDEIRHRAVKSSKARLRWLGGAAVLLAVAVGALTLNPLAATDGKPFDPPRFTPFTVVKREVVSPTSVIVTVSRYANSTEDLYKDMWDKGIWSVEVKQPELQIARSYTPLPPIKPVEYSELRFLVRKEHRGEVSGYLHRLGCSSQIELRGPHPGFDIPENVAEVVFLAGGTGIAPALQAAYTTLERRDTEARVRIVWSNRRRDDCQGGGPLDGMDHQELGLIVQELEILQKKHPGRLTVDYVVDEENTFLNQKSIAQLTQDSGRRNVEGPKLLFISGPEGFVNHFAGPKRWEDGKEGQGVVAGVIGKMKLRDWTIWKL